MEYIDVQNQIDLEALLEDPDVRIIEMSLGGPKVVLPRVEERATYIGISDDVAANDHHPLSLVLEGDLFMSFGELDRKEKKREAKKFGRRVYERFVSMVRELRPSYGAITVEDLLPCPADLRRDPAPTALGTRTLVKTILEAPISLGFASFFSDGYLEDVADGLYVSSYQMLNPGAKGIESVRASYLSGDVGKIIASCSRRA